MFAALRSTLSSWWGHWVPRHWICSISGTTTRWLVRKALSTIRHLNTYEVKHDLATCVDWVFPIVSLSFQPGFCCVLCVQCGCYTPRDSLSALLPYRHLQFYSCSPFPPLKVPVFNFSRLSVLLSYQSSCYVSTAAIYQGRLAPVWVAIFELLEHRIELQCLDHGSISCPAGCKLSVIYHWLRMFCNT